MFTDPPQKWACGNFAEGPVEDTGSALSFDPVHWPSPIRSCARSGEQGIHLVAGKYQISRILKLCRRYDSIFSSPVPFSGYLE